MLKDDFEPIVRCFDNEDIKIYPLGDLHYGAPEFMEKEWIGFKKKLLSEPNSYVVLVGDMMNNGLKSSVTNSYEETCRPRDQKRWLVKELGEITDKILCAVAGNHEGRSKKDADDDPLYDVCCELGIEERYRENGAFLILRMGDQRGNGKMNPTYTGCVMHGAGGGGLTGSAVNKNERFAYAFDGLDFLIVGHTHKPLSTAPCKVVIDKHNKKVSLRPFRVIIATAWLDYAGYALRYQMLPASHCLNELALTGCKKEMKVTQ